MSADTCTVSATVRLTGQAPASTVGAGCSILMRSGDLALDRAGTSTPLSHMRLPRTSGIQLHLTSLPGGKLGASAMAFVDWLAAAGQSWWQVLPLGPPNRQGSPYKAASAFAAWRGFLAEPDAPVSAAEREDFRARHAFWIDDWAAFAGATRAINDQVRFEREWTALRVYAHERGRAADRRRAHLRRGRQRRRRPLARALPRRRRGRRPAGRVHGQGPAVGQPDLRLARAAPPALSLVGRAPAADLRPLRPRPHRPLPRLRGLLGGAHRRARRLRRALGARAGPRRVRRRARRAGPPPAHRRGPRRHHAGGHAAARVARPAGDGRAAVRLQRARARERAPPRALPRRPGALHRHPRQRHAARLVRGPAARVASHWCAKPACAARAVVGPHGARAVIEAAAVHAAGPGRPRPGLGGAHEHAGGRGRAVALAACARVS